MTSKELNTIIDAVRFAHGRLMRDGVYISDENWQKMMRKLIRANAIIEKEDRQCGK